MSTITLAQYQNIMNKITKFDEMEQSVQNLSNKYDNLKKEYEKLKQDHIRLDKDHKALKSQVLKNNETIGTHNKAINNLEQYSEGLPRNTRHPSHERRVDGRNRRKSRRSNWMRQHLMIYRLAIP